MSDRPTGAVPGDEQFDIGPIEEGGEGEAPELDLDEDGNPVEPEEGGEEEEGGEAETPAAAKPRTGRPSQNQRLRERLERQDRELAELKGWRDAQQQQQRAQPVLDPVAQARAEQEKWERRAMMAPADALREVQEEARQEFRQAFQMQQFTTQDLIDKQAYEAQARTSRIHQQYQSQVETMLRAERTAGNYGATRDGILKYLVGQDAIARATGAAPAQRRAAAGRVSGQQARPTGARSDAARPQRPAADSVEAARARIAGKPLW